MKAQEIKELKEKTAIIVKRGGVEYKGEYVRPFGERMPTQHLVMVRYHDDVAPRLHRVSFTAITIAPKKAAKTKTPKAVVKVATPKAERKVVRTEDRFKSSALIAEGKKGGRWFLTSGLYTASMGQVTNTKTQKVYQITKMWRGVDGLAYVEVEANGAKGLIVSDPTTHESLTRWGIKATA